MSVKKLRMDPSSVSTTMPTLPSDFVDRANLLDAIETMFSTNTVVILDGPEGRGKSILSTAFVEKHAGNTLVLFLAGPNGYSYNPYGVALELYGQVMAALKGEETSTPQGFTPNHLRIAFYELQRWIRRTGTAYFVVIDGFDSVPSEEKGSVESVLDLLPIGLPGFKFLMGGEPPAAIANAKTFTVPGFTLDESGRFLSDCAIDTDHLTEFYRLTKGAPAALASVKRLLKAGHGAQSLLDQAPEHLGDLLALEWESLGTTSEAERLALAVVTFAREEVSASLLSGLTGLTREQVLGFLGRATFLTSGDEGDSVTFASSALRRYAAKKLDNLKSTALEMLIADLAAAPQSERSVRHMPEYLALSGNDEGLLNYLSPSYFQSLLVSSESVGILQSRAEMGLQAASRLGREIDALGFTVQRSSLIDLDSAAIRRTEIAARLSLGDDVGARTLASSTPLREERLALLARIARSQSDAVDESLLDQIRNLVTLVDARLLGERAVEIAADLLFCAPDLAVSLVERASGGGKSRDAFDWSLAQLSLQATVRGLSRESPGIQSVHSQIADPKAREAAGAFANAIREKDADTVLAAVQQLPNVADKLLFLRVWIRENRLAKDALRIAHWALKQAIAATELSLDARTVRELCLPLPYAEDDAEVAAVIGLADAQRANLELVGPTDEWIRLQLLIARAESKRNQEVSHARLVDLYLSASAQPDIATRAGALARILAVLPEVDRDGRFEKKDKLGSICETELKAVSEQLLLYTADHHLATKEVVAALSIADPKRALELAKSLNTRPRRDAALETVVTAITENQIAKWNVEVLRLALASIEERSAKERALSRVVGRLARRLDDVSRSTLKVFLEELKDCADAYQKCSLVCLIAKSLGSTSDNESKELLNYLLDLVEQTWPSLDPDWRKADVGFRIAEAFAKAAPDTAKRYLSKAESEREHLSLETAGATDTVWYATRLAMQAFAGLLPKRAEGDEDAEAIKHLIQDIPSLEAQAVLWSDLAEHYLFANRKEDCERVVSRHLRPTLTQMSHLSFNLYEKGVLSAAAALYHSHRVTALELFRSLTFDYRERCYGSVIDSLLLGRTYSGPREFPDPGSLEFTYEQAVEALDIARLMESDGDIFVCANRIASTVGYRSKRYEYSGTQVSDLSERIEQLANTNFPSTKFITHRGYQIATLAQAYRLRTNRQDWGGLIEAARQIPNQSDRAFVLSIIAEAMPAKSDEERRRLFEEAERLAAGIPVVVERVELFEKLSTEARSWRPDEAKRLIKTALDTVLETGGRTPEYTQRRLVDFAYRLDPEIASRVAATQETDPARLAARERIAERVKVHDGRKDLLEGKAVLITGENSDVYSEAAWSLLSSLNTHRLSPKRLDEMTEALEVASRMPLAQSYPILSWIIENAVQRYSQTAQARTILGPLFRTALRAAEVAQQVSKQAASRLRVAAGSVSMQPDQGRTKPVAAGDRNAALKVLKNWLRQNSKGRVKIADPYFGPDELALLQDIATADPGCKVSILTSRKHQEQTNVSRPWSETYADHWRAHVSSEEPPATEVVIAGLKTDGRAPLHERWILTQGAGLVLGTSINSLGGTQESSIDFLDSNEAQAFEARLDKYLTKAERAVSGEKIQYESFTM